MRWPNELGCKATNTPKDLASNWIPTGDAFFLWFRLYGPEEHLFNRSWMLPDLDRVARYCHALLLLAQDLT
jgi:hypothetical protein